MKKMIAISASLVALWFGGIIQAQADLIQNGGFEQGGPDSGWRIYQDLEGGWEAISGAGIEVQAGTTGGMAARSGNNKVELDSHNGRNGGLSGVPTNTVMAQEISGLTVGSIYEFSFWYTGRPAGGDGTDGIDVYWDTFKMFDSGSIIDTILNDDVIWIQYSYDLVATQNTMFIGLGATDKWGSDGDTLGAYVDDLSLVAKVPETSSIFLMSMGLVGLAFARKKSRNA